MRFYQKIGSAEFYSSITAERNLHSVHPISCGTLDRPSSEAAAFDSSQQLDGDAALSCSHEATRVAHLQWQSLAPAVVSSIVASFFFGLSLPFWGRSKKASVGFSLTAYISLIVALLWIAFEYGVTPTYAIIDSLS